MEKIDFRRQLKSLYAPKAGDFILVDVPAMNFLMIDGHGDPNVEVAYAEAVEALYSLSYTLKFMSKKAFGRDYAVPPLEGLWWAEDIAAFTSRRKAEWDWTMMIMQPDWIAPVMVEEAKTVAAEKKKLPALSRVRFEQFREGLSLQTLHLGSYDDEAPVLQRLHNEIMPGRSLTFAGKHHEIYLSDPRKVATAKLKTILRQPVRQLAAPALKTGTDRYRPDVG